LQAVAHRSACLSFHGGSPPSPRVPCRLPRILGAAHLELVDGPQLQLDLADVGLDPPPPRRRARQPQVQRHVPVPPRRRRARRRVEPVLDAEDLSTSRCKAGVEAVSSGGVKM
jgi:hypothetical protein